MRPFDIKTVGIFLALGLAACATRQGRPLKQASIPAGLRHELVQIVKTRNGAIQTMRGVARIRLGAKFYQGRGESVLLVKRPDSLRVDALTDFGAPRYKLAILRGDLTIYWPQPNQFFRGLAGGDSLERFFSLPLDPETVVTLLSGGFSMDPEEDYVLTARQYRKDGTIAYCLKGPTTEFIFEKEKIEGASLPVQATAFDLGGEKKYRVLYKDFQKRGEFWFPKDFDIRFWEPGFTMEIVFRDVEINPPLDRKLFQVEIPHDASRLEE